MRRFSLNVFPDGLDGPYRKKNLVKAAFIEEPFVVETQEGDMEISPNTVDDWEDGYYILYPDDGSKPYTNSPSFFEANYVLSGS